jgi:hypothetical protein
MIKELPKTFFIFTALCFFLSCGIEEYYYLPQVPQGNIFEVHFNTEATIRLPPINRTEFYYFEHYSIYYRIYVSEDLIDIENRNSYTPELRGDFDAIAPFTDPTNTSASTSVDLLFRNRNYHMLRFVNSNGTYINNNTMLAPGRTIRIFFPTASGEHPVATLVGTSNENIRLCRSISMPFPDQYFINSSVLRSDNRNADVARRNGTHSFVSMYIVATGYNSETFQSIYSKPTHINFFRLPDEN